MSLKSKNGETIMTRLCLDCGQKLIGRSDKKFCDDACRSHYNNQKQNEDQMIVRKINALLKSNRTILKRNNPDGKVKIKKEKLISDGFLFTYFTHQYITSKGNIYYFCYDYGYLYLNNDEVLLVRREIDS